MRDPIQAHPVSRCSPTAGRGVAGFFAASGVKPSLCANATVQDGQACINIPILGPKCISVPSIVPNGSTASLCAHICTHHFKPVGVCLTATVNNNQIASHCFGSCTV